MQKNIIITGEPKSGKSTLLVNIIKDIPNTVGIVTKEIRKDDTRVGFEIESHANHKAILAHVETETKHKVSKYFVNVENLESMLPEISIFKKEDVLYLDEIGQMQLFSKEFKKITLQFLDTPNTCIATLTSVYSDEFTQSIKNRNDIILIELTKENREQKETFVRALLKKIEKARRYLSEPERFTIKGSKAELKSEHGLRKLTLQDGEWKCDCEFFNQYAICSHVIAVKEFAKS
jgi:nucleoside-triphosphatase